MSRKGECWHNAPTESFFNSLENERVHEQKHRTQEQAKADLFEYIKVYYNRRRRHSGLDYRSPVQFLQDWIDAVTEQIRRHEVYLLEDEKRAGRRNTL